MRPLVALAFMVLAAWGAPAASAATVQMDPGICQACDGVLAFEAAPGEPNRVTVSGSSPAQGFVFHDAGAPLAVSTRRDRTASFCASVDEHTVRCEVVPLGGFSVRL